MGDIGALANVFKSGPNEQSLEQNGYSQYGGGTAPSLNMNAYGGYAPAQTTAGQTAQTQINQGQANQFLGGQQGLVSALQAQAAGQGPNPSQQQYQQNTQQAIAQQAALGAARGDQNPGLASAMQANQAAQMQQGMAGQEAINQSNQQLGAEGALGQALGSYGGQQIGLAENQAGLNQQTALANTLALNQANSANANAANAASQFGINSAQAGNDAQQAQFQYGQTQANQSQNQLNQILGGMATNSANNAGTFAGNAIGGAANAGGAALSNAFSGSSSGAGSTNSAGSSNWSDGTSGWDDNDYVGGEFNKPTKLRVGDRGPEAVIPLDGSQGDPHAFLNKMIAHMQAGGDGKALPSPIDQLAEALAMALKAKRGGK